LNKPKTIDNYTAVKLTLTLPQPYNTIVQLAHESGLRISDILNLRKDDVRQSMRVIETKTKKPRKFEISSNLYNKLRDLCIFKNAEDFVFSGLQRRTQNKALNRSTVHRRLKICSAHSLRKLYAQNEFKRTGDIFAVQRLLNHKYVTTTATYLDIDLKAILAGIKPPT